jgi:D-galactarolactone isomerase
MAACFPFSAGNAQACTALPAGACDCHIHIYDQRVPAAPGARLHPPDASLADYRAIQVRMGTRRAVVVTPSTYGTDNRLLLAALDALGPDGRGVAVIDGHASEASLQDLHTRGVRGARINLSQGVTHDANAIAHLAERIAPLGWHLQVLMSVSTLLDVAPVLRELPVDLVFDHFARISPAQGGQHPAHDLVLDLLRQQRAWVKLSGGYLVSPLASTEDPALDALAQSYIDAAPDRVVWGSDWPHATASAGHQPMPDDARQVDCLARWAGTPERLHAILVTNPERLYGFQPEVQP